VSITSRIFRAPIQTTADSCRWICQETKAFGSRKRPSFRSRLLRPFTVEDLRVFLFPGELGVHLGELCERLPQGKSLHRLRIRETARDTRQDPGGRKRRVALQWRTVPPNLQHQLWNVSYVDWDNHQGNVPYLPNPLAQGSSP
jgi:hypothetical protein